MTPAVASTIQYNIIYTMKRLGTLLCTLCALLLCACDEEKEAPLLFDVIANSAPETTTIGYFSPSATGGVKEYHVYTDFGASELKLQCANCRDIAITCQYRKPCVLEGGGSSSTEATAEEAGMDVYLSESNVITVRFDSLATADNLYGYYGTIRVSRKSRGKDEQTTVINLNRRNNELDRL